MMPHCSPFLHFDALPFACFSIIWQWCQIIRRFNLIIFYILFITIIFITALHIVLPKMMPLSSPNPFICVLLSFTRMFWYHFHRHKATKKIFNFSYFKVQAPIYLAYSNMIPYFSPCMLSRKPFENMASHKMMPLFTPFQGHLQLMILCL